MFSYWSDSSISTSTALELTFKPISIYAGPCYLRKRRRVNWKRDREADFSPTQTSIPQGVACGGSGTPHALFYAHELGSAGNRKPSTVNGVQHARSVDPRPATLINSRIR